MAYWKVFLEMTITAFRDEYRFLSNFWPAPVEGPGQIVFPTVEHAYVAWKTDNPVLWKEIATIEHPGRAKRLGRIAAAMRPDWDKIKLPIMRNLIWQKFQDPELFRMLQETKPHEIIEGNTWGDTFWGQCPIGTGHNHLGKILMEVRDNPLLSP